jgi:hypothetical protein
MDCACLGAAADGMIYAVSNLCSQQLGKVVADYDH